MITTQHRGSPPTLAISRDGTVAAWRRADGIVVRTIEGATTVLPVDGAFDFVGQRLYVVDGDAVRSLEADGELRTVTTDLPPAETRSEIRATPRSDLTALIRRDGRTLRLDARGLHDLTSMVSPATELVLPLPGGQLCLAGPGDVLFLDPRTHRATRIRADLPAMPTDGASILGGVGVVIGSLRRNAGTLQVVTTRGGVIHRIDLPAWRRCAIAEERGLAILLGADQMSVVDLRFGRQVDVLPLSHPVIDVAIDANANRVALVIQRDEVFELAFFDFGEARRLAHDAAASEPRSPAGSEAPHLVPEFLETADEDEEEDDDDGLWARLQPAQLSRPLEEAGAPATIAPAAPTQAPPPPQLAMVVDSWAQHRLVESEPPATEPPAPAGARGYGSHNELVADYAERIRLLLARYLSTHAAWILDAQGRRNDRAVSPKEVETFLAQSAENLRSVQVLDRRLDDHRVAMKERLAATPPGVEMPLRDIRRRFGLSDEAMDCLVTLFLAETELAFLRAFTYAWSDFTRKHVTVGFLAELIGVDDERRKRVLETFEPSSPMLRLGLAQPVDGNEGLIARSVRISQRVAWCILRGPGWLRDHPEPSLRVEPATLRLHDLLMDETSAASIKKVATAIVTLPGPVRYQLNGAAGSGRRSLARALAAEAGRSLTMVTLTTDLTTQVSPRRAASSVIAEALLTDSWVAILTDGILEDAQEAAKLQREWLRTFYSTIAEKVGGVFVVTEHLIALPDLEHACAPLLAPYPSATTQRIMWEDAARRHRTELPRALDADVLSRYVSLAPGSIDAAVARAVRMLTAAGTPAQRLDAPVLMRAVRQELSSRMGTVATRVEKHGRWEDLVLPPTTRDKIHELIAFARNRKRVLQDWQLTDKFAYGTSLTALFSGPPGTGKTMVAGVIAQTLGLELYRIDLSRVMSKWVGETERNLSIVFDEAERSQAILLFDEADSLFAKRTQVTSVQDRYANLETNFLLQRIESYEGIAVLTTNFETSIDEAFLRRIRFRIRFELPSRKERKRLWRSLLPASVPKEEAIDLDFLASSFELPGGLIKNAVLRACVAAAEASKGVSTRLLAACAELELAETGRLVAERYRSALHAL